MYATDTFVVDWSDTQYDYDSVPSQPSKATETYLFNCYGVSGGEGTCLSTTQSHVAGATSASITNRQTHSDGASQTINIEVFYDYVDPMWGASNTSVNKLFTGTRQITYSCPPEGDDFILYNIGRDVDGDGQLDKCYSQPELKNLIDPEEDSNECPYGYYKLKIQIDGELQCKSVSCDAAGDGKVIWASGSVYTNNSGTYCDGSCAHTVEGGQNGEGYDDGFAGNIRIYGVSTGKSCGQGTDFSMYDDDGSSVCESIDVGTGTPFLSCVTVEPEDPEDPEEPDEPDEAVVDLDEELVNNDDIPDLPNTYTEPCSGDNVACEIRNLKEKLDNENTEKKEQDNTLHNKSITALEKSTTSIVTNITQSSDDAAERNADGFMAVTDSIDKLADAITDGNGTGGGGDSDDGFCDTDGNCTTTVETKTVPSEGLTGFWVSEYETGFEGMFMEKIDEYKETELFLFLDNFKPSISGGSAPNFDWCFNFGGFMNLGCFSLAIDPRIYPALKIFLLISAVFACRIIIFGG